MSVYRDVCEKMKLNFGIQTNEKKNSVLLNSMIELLLMSPPRPLLTMLSTSVLILRMLRSKTKKKKLYTMLSTENIRQIRDGHATVAVRILAIVRHWHCTRKKKNALIFKCCQENHNSQFAVPIIQVRREKAEHESYLADLEKNRSVVRTRCCHMLLVLEEQYGAMAESPPSLRLILNRVDALLPLPSSAAAVPLPHAKSEQVSDEMLSEMTRARQTVQKWLTLRWLMRELSMVNNADVDPLTSVIGCKSQVKVGTRIEIKKLTP